MDNAHEHFANVGEWSELYVLGYLLSEGGAFAADAQQSAIENVFYEVLNVQLANKDSTVVRYEIENDLVYIRHASGKIKTLPRAEIKSALNRLFEDLSEDANSKTFTIESGNYLANLLDREFVSAGSQMRTYDMELVLKDPDNSVVRPKVGFSIKSQLGSPSTLLNASGATNFTFRIDGTNSKALLSELNLPQGSVIANLEQIFKAGYELELEHIDNSTFESNLTRIDSVMPENLAKLLLTFYRTGNSKLANVADIAFPKEDPSSEQKIYKTKQLLGSIAMGMRPSTAWDGDSSKFKGMIVVKAKGDVVVYYVLNLPDFQEFLFHSVRFERGSTSRHKYGQIYTQNGENYIKLNLQIRFTK